MGYAEVAVDAPAGYARTFSYSVPPDLPLAPGQLVRVPFGPRVLQGIVFQLTDHPQVPLTKEIAGAEYPEPLLSPAQLQLSLWLSRYYLSSLFEAAALMLPPGFRARSRAYLSANPATGSNGVSPLTTLQEQALDYIRKWRTAEEAKLEKALGTKATRSVEYLVRHGLVTRSWRWDRPRVRAKFISYLALANSPEEVRKASSLLARRAPNQASLLAALAAQENAPGITVAQAAKAYGRASVTSLLKKGLIATRQVRVERDPLEGRRFKPDEALRLTPTQEQAVAKIKASLEGLPGSPRTFLLHGVTGSGKTEVYLQALASCIALGKRGIVLVPEISLTPQTTERFGARFSGKVAVQHSGLSAGEQFDQWWRIRDGEYPAVIGARSAIFSPQPNLGLIVIDEEHEWTYKERENAPRFNTRDVAFQLARLTGATVVLGSATPDVVTHFNASRGVHQLLALPQRIGVGESGEALAAPLASVELVDMRRELREGNRNIFSRALRLALGRCLEAGDQAILFLNRRGAASAVQCRDCGKAVHCSRCDVPLTFHITSGRLLCHHCGRSIRPPEKCPQCQSSRIRYLGVGTQRVVEELSQLFPKSRVLRWDRDAARRPREHEALMERFASGGADILVGTQMISKGLHLPGVTLVGVVCADIGLNVPDFRAGEQVFQVLCQVAGRSGRGPGAGRVIIQTYVPHHYAIQAAAKQDYNQFYQQELEFRRGQADPPFRRLAHLVYTHTNSASCQRGAEEMARALRQARDARGIGDADIIGPAPAYPPRVRGRYRWHLVIRSPDPSQLLNTVPVRQGWTMDIDPVSVL